MCEVVGVFVCGDFDYVCEVMEKYYCDVYDYFVELVDLMEMYCDFVCGV